MNIFDSMSRKALSITSANSDGTATYTQGATSVIIEPVIEHDVEQNPDILLSGISEKMTVIHFDYGTITRAKPGDTITMTVSGDVYEVDDEIGNDGSVIAAVVK